MLGGAETRLFTAGFAENHREGRQGAWFVVNLSDVGPVFGPGPGSA